MKEKVRVLFPFVGDTVGGSHISALTLARAKMVCHQRSAGFNQKNAYRSANI